MGKLKISENTSIYMLVDLDVNICRYLYRYGILTVGQLVDAYPSEVSKIRLIGKKRLNYIAIALSYYDVVADSEGGDSE